MSDRMPFALTFPARALLIDEVRSRLLSDGFDEIDLGGDELGTVVCVQEFESTWISATEVLKRLRLPFNEHADAKYEYDSTTRFFRPPALDHGRKPTCDRIMQSNQDGDEVYVSWTSIVAAADAQGKIDLTVLRAKHGPPESIEDWLAVDDHQRCLNNLILRDPAFRCPVEQCGLPLLEIPPLPEDGVVGSCRHCETDLVWSSDGPLDGAWAVKEEDEEAAS